MDINERKLIRNQAKAQKALAKAIQNKKPVDEATAKLILADGGDQFDLEAAALFEALDDLGYKVVKKPKARSL